MPPKQSPLILRTVVFLFSMVSGAYVLSISINQANFFTFQTFNMVQKLCPNVSFLQSEIPYLHFPNPTSFFREECGCNPVRFFTIISMQRSGSGWFETLLNSHINVSSNGEIFGSRDRRNNASMIYGILDKVYNLEWYSSASKNECSAAVGFKWMLNQGVMEFHKEIEDYFKRRGVHAIFLFRRNNLRRLISLLANEYDKEAKLLNGTHKSHVHSPHEAQVLASYKPRINTTLLIINLKNSEQMTLKAIEYFKSIRSLILYYEDVVSNNSKLIEVEDFLRLPRRNLTSGQVKIHKGSLSSQVENWEEVQRTLKGTAYERYLQVD